MNEHVVVTGAGIGGLACALALARAGVSVDVLEQSAALGEVGAGLQLGPNAVGVLHAWGLSEALQAKAAYPEALVVQDAHSGSLLGHLPLGERAARLYGHPYATLHRADLQALLMDAVVQESNVALHLNSRVDRYEEAPDGVKVITAEGKQFSAAALVGCDGLWSQVRKGLLGDHPARATGHLAYRGMVRVADVLPGPSRKLVNAWLGPKLHAVHYPVRGGEWLNVVVVVHGQLGQGHGGAAGSDPQSWTHQAHAVDLQKALMGADEQLIELVNAVEAWTLWPLNDRAPMASAAEHAKGRVALLGDAAHPMRPYLAQGAAMALEDAWTLGQLAQQQAATAQVDWPAMFQRYANTRWERNARVQARSVRNGAVFHAQGPLRWGRNVAMAALGNRLLDNAWLYSGPPDPVA